MPDPFAPLRRLADTSDLASLDDEAIGKRARALTDALETLPEVHAEMRAARQAMGIELREQRKLSIRKIAAMIGRSPTRVTQILRGETTHTRQPADGAGVDPE